MKLNKLFSMLMCTVDYIEFYDTGMNLILKDEAEKYSESVSWVIKFDIYEKEGMMVLEVMVK